MKPMTNDFIDCAKRYLMSYPILFNKVDKTFGKEFKYIIEMTNKITSLSAKQELIV